jgi:hypothetical protein
MALHFLKAHFYILNAANFFTVSFQLNFSSLPPTL